MTRPPENWETFLGPNGQQVTQVAFDDAQSEVRFALRSAVWGDVAGARARLLRAMSYAASAIDAIERAQEQARRAVEVGAT